MCVSLAIVIFVKVRFFQSSNRTSLALKMAIVKGSVLLTLAAFGICASVPPNFQIQSGFEFLAAIEGKVFVRPIRASTGTDDLSYQEAIAKCASAGYKIATIENAAQNAAIEQSICDGFRWAWIDGVDFQIPDAFFSINTGRNLTYFNWSQWGECPSIGKDDRNCIRISCNSIDGTKWWDVRCTDKYTVICQVEMS